MRTRIVAIVLLGIMSTLCAISPVLAANPTVTITVTAEVIAITNSPDNYGFGVVATNTSVATPMEYFTLNNTGSCAVDVEIQGTNLAGGDDTWTLSDTATAGENTVGMIASTDSETLYQYYDTGKDNSCGAYEDIWEAQTFTPANNHTITTVSLLLYRNGTPGTITVGIRNTTGGEPTGTDLCYGTTNGDTLTTNSSGEWRDIVFDNNVVLTAATQYAIVVRAPLSIFYDMVLWNEDTSTPTYAGGNRLASNDTGESWVAYNGTDCLFKEYGGNFDIIVKPSPSYNTLVSNLAAEDSEQWALRFLMPVSLSGYDANEMAGTITLVASKHE